MYKLHNLYKLYKVCNKFLSLNIYFQLALRCNLETYSVRQNVSYYKQYMLGTDMFTVVEAQPVYTFMYRYIHNRHVESGNSKVIRTCMNSRQNIMYLGTQL